MTRRHPFAVLVCLAAASFVYAQEPPLLTLFPRAEEVRRLELRADVMMARKRFPEAAEVYLRAFRLNPKNAPIANKLGIAHFHMQDYGQAKVWYERALKLNRQFFEPQNNLGMVFYARREYKKARRYFEQALRLRPESGSAHFNLGATYLGLKKPDEALGEYRLALLLDPQILERRTGPAPTLQTYPVEHIAQFHFILAKSLATLGDVERCLAYLRRALEEGFRELDRLKTEPEFALLREDVRFQQLLAEPPRPLQP